MSKIAQRLKRAACSHLTSRASPAQWTERLAQVINQVQVQQHSLGNQVVQRMLHLGMIRAKLKINPPDDKYEQEADRVADQVMRMPDPLSAGVAFSSRSKGMGIQRACPLCDDEELKRQPLEEEEDEEILQTKKAFGHTPEIAPALAARVTGLHGRGQPMPEFVRAFFEPRFGRDFSRVRLHTDALANAINIRLNSRAVTKGYDVFFQKNAYNPATSDGLRLLAHELAHVAQQQGGKSFQFQEDRSPHKASLDYIMRDPFPGENPELYERRRQVIELIPRIVTWISDFFIMRGSAATIIGLERWEPSTGRFIIGDGSDWPPETLSQRRERLLNFVRDLEDILDQLRRGPIPPGWVSMLREEEALEEEERSRGQAPVGQVSGFGGVVEDLIHFYTQFAWDVGRNRDLVEINIFYINSYTQRRGRLPTAQPMGVYVIVPDPSRPTRVISVTGSTGFSVDLVSGRPIPPEGQDIREVYRDARGYFYYGTRGRVYLEHFR
jgi:hypothetical protein